jgi:hypothetical protein
MPFILTESPDGLKDIPEEIELVGARLAKGLDNGFIPQGLRVSATHLSQDVCSCM